MRRQSMAPSFSARRRRADAALRGPEDALPNRQRGQRRPAWRLRRPRRPTRWLDASTGGSQRAAQLPWAHPALQRSPWLQQTTMLTGSGKVKQWYWSAAQARQTWSTQCGASAEQSSTAQQPLRGMQAPAHSTLVWRARAAVAAAIGLGVAGAGAVLSPGRAGAPAALAGLTAVAAVIAAGAVGVGAELFAPTVAVAVLRVGRADAEPLPADLVGEADAPLLSVSPVQIVVDARCRFRARRTRRRCRSRSGSGDRIYHSDWGVGRGVDAGAPALGPGVVAGARPVGGAADLVGAAEAAVDRLAAVVLGRAADS